MSDVDPKVPHETPDTPEREGEVTERDPVPDTGPGPFAEDGPFNELGDADVREAHRQPVRETHHDAEVPEDEGDAADE